MIIMHKSVTMFAKITILVITLIVYFSWYIIAHREFDMITALIDLFLSHMAAIGIYISCCSCEIK